MIGLLLKLRTRIVLCIFFEIVESSQLRELRVLRGLFFYFAQTIDINLKNSVVFVKPLWLKTTLHFINKKLCVLCG